VPDDSRIQQLLDELLDSGATPEEVCGSCPELLPEVRTRWQQIRRLRVDLDALFPLSGKSPTRPPEELQALPQIPGYEIEDVLGRGGMGIVFRARHLRLNRPVALKMVLAGTCADARERGRFQREAEALAGLRHPNVVQVHDVGEYEGRPYFTMELVEGGSLSKNLAGTPLSARPAAQLMMILSGAVQAAHACAIVHRDLKPSNVLLTADGTPKISDFGLARRLDDESGLTQTGVAVGTPSYMAPEQAEGRPDAVGPAVDIYALGAILYELLTGRPPFKGATAAETIHQVISRDPVAPSRLNPNVPRDLETVCLKCLHKSPARRYPTAAALEEEFNRFLRGEAVAARPEGGARRLLRRIRRRPALSAAVAGVVVLAGALVGGAGWYFFERTAVKRAAEADQSATERAAADDLADMVRELNASRWPAATAALARARGRLGERGPDEQQRLMRQGEDELRLAARLNEIRLRGTVSAEGVLASDRYEREYEDAFREAGLGQLSDDPAIVAERIRGSNIPDALITALDHWSVFVKWAVPASDPRRKEWALRVARLADRDRDPTGWRDRARDPLVLNNTAEFDRMIADTRFDQQPVALLLALANEVGAKLRDPLEFLKRIQQAHSDDFWSNYSLADVLRASGDHRDALRYYQVARALQPKSSIVVYKIGWALGGLGRHKEALEHYRMALGLDPTAASAHNAVAVELWDTGQRDEALEALRAGLLACRDPDAAQLHSTLGDCLAIKGRYDEADEQHRKAVALAPENADRKNAYRKFLMRRGRPDEARVMWQAALDSAPPEHKDWYGYAEFCLYLGHEDEYRRARRALLSKFETTTAPEIAERVSRACLLLPAEGDELRRTVALAERGLDRSKNTAMYPYLLFVRGLAEYRQGQFDRAIETMRGGASGVLGPAPRLVLAMAVHKSGQSVQEARKALAAAIVGYDWAPAAVRDQDGWIFHALRREAERMILPDLPAFLDGKYQPKDYAERLALCGACEFLERHRTVARLSAEAFVSTAGDGRLNAQHRYVAARAAALAGCGRGADAAGADEAERGHWRKKALSWLRADLAAWVRVVDTNPARRDGAREMLTYWQGDAGLACVRDPRELEKLPADERKEFVALWDEVAAVIARTKK
jgi:serine/threonine-protein kinase